MSRNTLCNAIKNLELSYQLTPYQLEKFDEFFAHIKVGDLIYPGQLKSRLATDIKMVYQMLEELREQGYLAVVYEVYCRNCSKTKGIFLDSLSEFNEEYHCDFCDNHLNPLKDIIVLYRVVAL